MSAQSTSKTCLDQQESSTVIEISISAQYAVGWGAAVDAFDVTIVVGAGELIADDWVLAAAFEPELEGVFTAELVAVVVAAAMVLDAGVNEGVVAVQAVQIVTVSVVKKVETLVTMTSEVDPPLPWVVVVTGQLVTVVYITSVVMTSMVDVCTGTGLLWCVLIRCLLVAVDETSELAGVDDRAVVWAELGAEDVLELESALEVDETAEVWVVLETGEVLGLGVTLEVEGTADVTGELVAEEVWKFDDTLDFVLDTDVTMVECELQDWVLEAALEAMLECELETEELPVECALDDGTLDDDEVTGLLLDETLVFTLELDEEVALLLEELD